MNRPNKDKHSVSSSHRQYNKTKFEDRYRRMTIYVEQDLFEQVQYYREQGNITNLTEFVNKALICYMNESNLTGNEA